ncbi:hypothetical protein ISCGN_008514 [Ixodes scapularis]
MVLSWVVQTLSGDMFQAYVCTKQTCLQGARGVSVDTRVMVSGANTVSRANSRRSSPLGFFASPHPRTEVTTEGKAGGLLPAATAGNDSPPLLYSLPPPPPPLSAGWLATHAAKVPVPYQHHGGTGGQCIFTAGGPSCLGGAWARWVETVGWDPGHYETSFSRLFLFFLIKSSSFFSLLAHFREGRERVRV